MNITISKQEEKKFLKEHKRISNIIACELQQFTAKKNNSADILHKQNKNSKRKLCRQLLKDIKEIDPESIQDGHLFSEISSIIKSIPDIVDSNFVISILLFVADLWASQSISGFILATIHFLRSIFKEREKYIDLCVKFAENQCKKFLLEFQDGFLFGECTINSLNDILNLGKGITKTKVWTSIINIVNYIACFIMNIFHVDNLESSEDSFWGFQKYIKKPSKDGISMVGDIFENLIFLMRQGYQSIHVGYPMSFFYTETSMATWITSVNQVMLDYANLNSPDNTLRKQKDTVLRTMQELAVKGSQMKPIVNKAEKCILMSELYKLQIEGNKLHNSMVASKVRKAPFVVMVNGNPCVGKTSFMKILEVFYARLTNKEVSDESRYVRCFADPYWSGMKTTCWCVILDDIAFENPNKVTSLQESSLSDVIQISNNMVFSPNMASLEEKGTVFCMPDLVLASTNCKHLNADALFETPYAVMRRFPYIISIKPKAQYSADGFSLSTQLIPKGTDDLWDIVVQKPQPLVDGHKITTTYNESDTVCYGTIQAFLKWYKGAILDHLEVQERIMDYHESAKGRDYCMECCIIRDNCTCPVIQDGLPHDTRAFEHFNNNEYNVNDEDVQVFTDWTYPHAGHFAAFLNSKCIAFISSTLINITLICFTGVFFNPFMITIFILFSGYHTYTWWMYSVTLIKMLLLILFGYLPFRIRKFIVKLIGKWFIAGFIKNQRHFIPICTSISVILGIITSGTLIYKYSSIKKVRKACPPPFKPSVTSSLLAGKKISEENLFALQRRYFKALSELKGEGKKLSDHDIEWLNNYVSSCEENCDYCKENVTVQDGTNSNDVYYNDIEHSVSWDFGLRTSSWKNYSAEDVQNHLSTNIVKIFSESPSKMGVGIFIESNVILTNCHLFKGMRSFKILDSRYVAGHSQFMKVSDWDVREDESRDLMTIRLRNVFPRKRIIDLIPKKSLCDLKCSGFIHTRNIQGKAIIFNSKNLSWDGPMMVSHPLIGEQLLEYYKFVGCDTKKGDCGSPYVAMTPTGPAIIAIHQSFTDGNGLGVVLTQDVVRKMVEPLSYGIQGGSLVRPTMQFNMDKWSANSNLRQIENPHCVVFGTTGHRFPSKSRIIPSMIYSDCIEKGFVDDYGSPIMRNRKVWINQAIPMVERDFVVDTKLLDQATMMYIEETVNVLTVEDLSVVKVLTDDEAINGIDGVNYVDKLPRKTSAGFPYNTSKQEYLTINEDGRAEACEEIMDDFHEMEKVAKSGCRNMSIFMGNLKDETRTKKKIASYSTRLFTGCSFPFSILIRKYLLTTNALIQSHRKLFECFVGLDALGPGWENLFHWLNEFSSDHIAGDYSAYDKKMLACYIESAGRVLEAICKKAGYSNEDLIVIRSIITDLAFPVCNFDGDIIMTCGSEPSGHPLTVILNSIVGSILLRMAFINLINEGKATGNFKDSIRAAIYGDDNEMASKNKYFTHTYLQHFFLTQGLKYTMADKDSESVPFIDIEDVTFLKRDFFMHPELKRIVGRLDVRSIEKSLLYCLPSKAIDQEHQMVETMNTSCREMFFHGKEKFENHRDWCLKLINKYDLQSIVAESHFPRFDEIFAWYMEKWEAYTSQQGAVKGTQIQDGNFCRICEKDDCDLDDNDAIVCRRCMHCRPKGINIDETFFFGCMYCETDHPMWCDRCSSFEIYIQVVHDFINTPNFYCRDCYMESIVWSDYITARRSNGLDRCDPEDDTPPPSRLSFDEDGNSLLDFLISTGEQNFSRSRLSVKSYTRSLKSITASETSKKSIVQTRLNKPRVEVINSNKIQDGNVEEQETVSFLDIQTHQTTEIPHSVEEVSSEMAMDSCSLADFLSRPVLIHTETWAQTDTAGFKNAIYPWHLWANTATVKYKLNNWAFIKCNLHIRVVYNASPFYYGSMMLNWKPLSSVCASDFIATSYVYDNILFSQFPGRAMIEPQTPEDVEFVLPFFFPANFLKVQHASDFQSMGTLYFNILSALVSANGVTGIGITCKLYAWATEVVLSGPSIGLAMQDGVVDEYGMDGPVSKPASAIANVAARLGDVPIIGKFATATAIGANAVGHIAKLFGFTNVPVVSDQQGFQPRPVPPLASTDIGFPFEKLTVDSKNELTIDHESVGLGGLDELPITSIVQRESYLTSVDWVTSTAVDAVLFSSAVCPMLFKATSTTKQVLYMTPMCWLSTMFDYWRGDVIFRFRVICSKYHRGRLKISFDPDGYAGTNVVTDQSSHLIMTKIVDITEDTNVEMRVPYQAFAAWLKCDQMNTMTSSTERFGTSFEHERGYTNGNIVLTVQTSLTAPISPSTVKVHVFVRGAENLDFASPSATGFDRVMMGTLQDGTIEVPKEVKNQGDSKVVSVSSGAISRPIDHLYLTYMGERIASLRVLLRRMCRVYTHAPECTTHGMCVKWLTLHRLPYMMGYDSDALGSAKGINTPGTDYAFNWNQPNFLSYIYPAFRGCRGSVNWSIVFENLIAPADMVQVMRKKDKNTNGYGMDELSLGSDDTNHKFYYEKLSSLGSGGAIATGRTSNAINFQMPFYSQYKFGYTSYAAVNKTDQDYNTNDFWTMEHSTGTACETETHQARYHLSAGAGTDFDLLYFLHVPTYTVSSAIPTPT